MSRFSQKEQGYIVILVLLCLVLVVKSVCLDGYKPTNEGEKFYVVEVEKVLKERYSNVFYEKNVITYKIINLKLVTKDDADLVEHYDPIMDEAIMLELKGRYKAKIRKYIFGFLPVAHETVQLINTEEKVLN